jgi:carbon storage regulator
MLVLTRRPYEVIRVAKDVRIVVLGVKGFRVRIGIEAPLDIAVDREEIYLRKQAELSQAHADGNPG